ncbi:MAG: type II secretion system protein GspK [Bryobacterales bacterium]|nr:general secretion pathway protein GspK [Bryobacteraceae bacterium]MDW8354433.1 type II secretion system protein GspK [Bryobacterales bacterium]
MAIGKTSGARGGALILVLWLAAALAAVTLTLAQTVRTELERATTALESTQAYYLACGAIERALLYMLWGPPYYAPGATSLRFDFPSGEAVVQILPEAGKLNVNFSPLDELERLFVALGAEPARAAEIARAIVDWRSPAPHGPTLFDREYLSRTPSFRAAHASFQETEELLLVKGMTPELYYGTIEPGPEGAWLARGGARDCLSVYSAGGAVDVNSAHPAVLAAIGLGPGEIQAILATRPLRDPIQLQGLGLAGHPALGRLRLGGGSVVTLRAMARPRLPNGQLSDLRRGVGATVKLFGAAAGEKPYHVLRWYDQVWEP